MHSPTDRPGDVPNDDVLRRDVLRISRRHLLTAAATAAAVAPFGTIAAASAAGTTRVHGKAAAAIRRLTEALGGDAARAAVVERITATGWRRHPGWGTDPSRTELVADFAFTLIEDVVRPRYALTLTGDTHLVRTKLNYTEIGDGNVGYLDGTDFMFDPRPVQLAIPSWRVATRQRHFDLTSPLRLARKLAAPDANVTVAEGKVDGRPSTVLTLTEAGRPPVRIFLDGRSGLPVKAETLEEHSPLGDTLVAVRFDDYRRTGAVRLPHKVTITANGAVVHEEVRSRVEVADTVSDAVFAVPDPTVSLGSSEQLAYAHYSNQWILNYIYAGVRFYFDLQIAPKVPAPVDVAEGVKIVIGKSHNVLVVEMPDHLLAVDAPLYDEYTRSALGQVRAAFPGKPLRKVVGTHFHYDHIGGIREFAADGNLTVIAGESALPFYRKLFKNPHTVDPDRYGAHPCPVALVGVAKKLVLPTADGGRLEIHRIPNDHADDLVIVYQSTAKIVFQADLWNPTPVPPAPNSGRGRLATQLYDAIVTLGLDVEGVIGAHEGTDGRTTTHIAPLSYLKTAASR